MLLSREELDRSAEQDPQITKFFEDNPRPESSPDPAVLRNGLEAYVKATLAWLGDAPASQTETYHEIEMRDGYKSRTKINKPATGPAGPLIVLLYGGGFVAGSCDQLTDTARTMVDLFGATVVNTSYRLAPEHKFPIAQLDSWDSMKWIATNATEPLLNADPAKGFILGGVSAGGSIAGALSRKFQEDPLAYPLTGQWLCIPSLMHEDSVPEKYREHYISYEQNANTLALNKQTRDMITKATQWDASSDLRYAANSKIDMSGQPRTFFQVDGMDPLRDDGLIYDEMLKEAGVETRIDLYPGCPHGHWFQMRGIEIGDRAHVDTLVGFGWLLGKAVFREEVAITIGSPP